MTNLLETIHGDPLPQISGTVNMFNVLARDTDFGRVYTFTDFDIPVNDNRFLSFVGLLCQANQSQARALRDVFTKVQEQDLRPGLKKDTEVKRITIYPPIDGHKFSSIVIRTETGLEEDEGTMAAIHARDNRHVKIGPRGGLEAQDLDGNWVTGDAALRAHARF